MKNIVILGSTGSVGVQTLDIVRAFSDELNVVGLVANNNIQLLHKQIAEFQPNFINFNQKLISSIELQGSKHENNINIISKGIIGINIGQNKDTQNSIEDYCYCLEKLGHLGHYITINIQNIVKINTSGM